MTYQDVIVPIRKTNFGEADIIYSFLSAHHGRIEAIAKGIRKITSRKRGNLEIAAFSTAVFAVGKNLDIVTEAQLLEYNDQFLNPTGGKFLFSILPTINKLATDIEQSIKVFEVLKNVFLTYDIEQDLYFSTLIKYELLKNQDLLPDWQTCAICRVKYDMLDKVDSDRKLLVCNNCARKIEELFQFQNHLDAADFSKFSEEELVYLKALLDRHLKSIGI